MKRATWRELPWINDVLFDADTQLRLSGQKEEGVNPPTYVFPALVLSIPPFPNGKTQIDRKEQRSLLINSHKLAFKTRQGNGRYKRYKLTSEKKMDYIDD